LVRNRRVLKSSTLEPQLCCVPPRIDLEFDDAERQQRAAVA